MTTRYVPPDSIETGLVLLDRPAPPGGLVVALESLDTGVVTVPPSVAFDPWWIGAQFEITWVGVGATQVRASYGGAEAFLDISAPGVLPRSRAAAILSLVDIRPAATAGEDESLRPDGTVAIPLRPTASHTEPEQANIPKPTVGVGLRPKPYFAGE